MRSELNFFESENCMNNLKFVVFPTFILFYPSVAYAYVDPGTGAYLLQLLIAVFGAVVFYASRPMQLFQLIRDFFSKKNKK
jgi:hypothetical protein